MVSLYGSNGGDDDSFGSRIGSRVVSQSRIQTHRGIS